MNMKKIATAFVLLALACPSLFAKYTKEELTELMLANSPSIRAAEANREKSRYDYKSSIGALTPHIGYGFSAFYFGNPIDPVRLSYSELTSAFPTSLNNTGVGDGYVQLYEGSEKTFYTASLSVVQPITTWGKLINSVRIAKELHKITSDVVDMDIAKAKCELAGHLECYAYLRGMKKSLEVAYADVDELLELSRRGVAAGMITDAKNLETVTAAYQVMAAYRNVDGMMESELENIRTLVGIYDISGDDLDITLPDISFYRSYLDEDRFTLVAKALSPEQETMKMRKSQEKIAELNKKIKLASMPYSPDIVLTANMSYGTPRFPLIETNWSGKGSWQAMVGVSLSGTLFDGLSQYHNLASSKKLIESEKAMTKSTVRQLENTLVTALNTMETAFANIDYRQADFDEKRLAFEDAAVSYAEGNVSKVDYLTKEVKMASSHAQLGEEYIKLVVNYYLIKFIVE